MHYYIGRQPIFDTDLCVFGYELLYRPGLFDGCDGVNGDQATSQVILNSFLEMGLDKVVGPHHAFINLTRNFIVNDSLLPPSKPQLVLEILEDIEVDTELINAVQRLQDRGYTIALDDFAYHPKLRPLVELAHIVKLDIRAIPAADLGQHVAALRQFPVKLLAEKVETPEEFDHCKDLGFDYFQGYFLCRPRVIKGNRLPGNRLNTMRMVAQLQSAELNIDSLEQIITQDVAMSYRMLRYINSAAFGLNKKIDSIRHAIIYLGVREIRNWASLIALSGIDDKPNELIVTALKRAKMCELLHAEHDPNGRGGAFLVGLFSTLDAMMDSPMEELITMLPLSPEITDALIHHTGPYARALLNTVAHEQGEWDMLQKNNVTQGRLTTIFVDSLTWAQDTVQQMAGAIS